MTVEQLIKQLQSYPPQDEVFMEYKNKDKVCILSVDIERSVDGDVVIHVPG